MATRGSIYPYDGPRGRTWIADVKWRGGQKKVGKHKSKGDAEKTLTELLASIDTGKYVTPSKLTLLGYLMLWLDGLAMIGPARRTIRSTAATS